MVPGLWSVTESGLAFAFGLALPTDARKISVFKGLRPHITSKVGIMTVLGARASVKGGEGGEMIRNLFREGVLEGAVLPPWGTGQPGGYPLLVGLQP